MSTPVLLEDLRRRGVAVSADGEHLRCRAPRGTLTRELLAAIGEHKATLLAELEAEAAAGALAHIEAELTAEHHRIFALYEGGDRAGAAQLQAKIRTRIVQQWTGAKRRHARALDRVGRLPAADRWLLEDPPATSSVWEPDPHGGWRETAEAAVRCVRCPASLAEGDRLFCDEHRSACRPLAHARTLDEMTECIRCRGPLDGASGLICVGCGGPIKAGQSW